MSKQIFAVLALLALAGCKAPVYGPSSLQIFDTDPSESLQGTVIVGRAQDETDITEYVLKWGTGNECESSGADIAKQAKGAGILRFDLPAGTSIPEGAQSLLAFSRNAAGVNKTCSQSNLYAAAPSTVILDKLEWMRCSLGQAFGGGRCTGDYIAYWHRDLPIAVAQANVANFAGNDDWRAPTIDELSSIRACNVNAFGDPTTPSVETITLPGGEIVFSKCDGAYQFRNPMIDEILFPDTHAISFITADEYWTVNFENGAVNFGPYLRTPVRLVRDVK